jgi:photosystem II stability/assembly factor-like uncharacterized protein
VKPAIRASLGFAATAACALSFSSTSFANGRYPLANQLVVDPKNPLHLVARATFGILDSDDGGQTWTWICEDAVGYFGVEDPAIAVMADGSIVVASSKGLSRSADGGCSWQMRTPPGGNRAGVDLAVNPMNPHEALALESSSASGAYSVFLVKTSDDGATWNEVAQLPAGSLAETVEIAPSNPDRVYVSGRVTPSQASTLLRSDDGGLTWTSAPIDVPTGASTFIGAVDPSHPDTVYVRVRVTANTLGRVHVTTDGGATWTKIWQGQGDVAGFALSPDGATLVVGGPDSHINVASTNDFVFESPNPLGPSCLTWSGGKLFACAKEAIDFFSIGYSPDKGISFVPVLHFPDVRPRACGAMTSAAVCASSWDAIASTIGVDAGTPDASPPAPPPLKVDAGGGWSCAVGAPRSRSVASAWVLVLASLFAMVRARCSRRSPPKR